MQEPENRLSAAYRLVVPGWGAWILPRFFTHHPIRRILIFRWSSVPNRQDNKTGSLENPALPVCEFPVDRFGRRPSLRGPGIQDALNFHRLSGNRAYRGRTVRNRNRAQFRKFKIPGYAIATASRGWHDVHSSTELKRPVCKAGSEYLQYWG
jgi:hypothetical protein